jgi:hypothetical protein
LAERVAHLHGLGQTAPEPDADPVEAGLLLLRHRLEPFDAVDAARVLEHEARVEIVRAEEDGGRRGGDRVADLADRHLPQVLVVEVQPLAVGDDQLLVGHGHLPAEAPGAREGERAGGVLAAAAAAAHLLLAEGAPRGLGAAGELAELIDGGGRRGARHRRERHHGSGDGAQERRADRTVREGDGGDHGAGDGSAPGPPAPSGISRRPASAR